MFLSPFYWLLMSSLVACPPQSPLQPTAYSISIPSVPGFPRPKTFSVVPIFYAIPAERIVKHLPPKRKHFSDSIPGSRKAFPLTSAGELAYYEDMRSSYFCVDMMKDGWDSLRHYEILANGCIPWFINISSCPKYSLYSYPKGLVSIAMQLPGVNCSVAYSAFPRGRLTSSTLSINSSLFDYNAWTRSAQKLLEYTQRWLTTESLASYVLRAANKSVHSKVLMLLQFENRLAFAQAAEYSVCTMIHGFRKLLGSNFIEFPEFKLMYKEYDASQPAFSHGRAALHRRDLYGGGFTYAFTLEGTGAINRSHIQHRIQQKEFDAVIYFFSRADTRGQLLWFEDVRATYGRDEIWFVDSFDAYDHWCLMAKLWCRRAVRRWTLMHRYGQHGIIFRREAT